VRIVPDALTLLIPPEYTRAAEAHALVERRLSNLR